MSGSGARSLPMLPQVRDASGCGCGTGQGVATPLQIYNRAGLPAVQYRIGDQASFKATLLSRLAAADYPALAALTTRDDSDFTIALLDAAATMGDVLTFYQERIANEVWLRTATEWRSLAAIGRLTGYEPSPGLAANARLAFTLADAAGSPLQTLIPAGTRLQSVPAVGQLPQTFETASDFTARPEWNAMPVVTSQAQPDFSASTASILLQGISQPIRAGEMILLLDSAGTPCINGVVGTTTDAAALTTRIDFATVPQAWPAWSPPAIAALPPLAPSPAPLSLALLQNTVLAQAWYSADLLAYVLGMQWDVDAVMTAVMRNAAQPEAAGAAAIRFRQHAAVFGHNAPAFNTLPLSLTTAATPGQASLISGTAIVAGGMVVEIADATVQNVNLTDATITAPIGSFPLGGWLPGEPIPAGASLLGGDLGGAVIIPAAPPQPAYPQAWTDQNTSLNFAWSENVITTETSNTVQLDHVYSGLGMFGYAVLMDSAANAAPTAFRITAIGETSAMAFSLNAKVTEITLGTVPGQQPAILSGFTRRGTAVLCDSEVLALAPVPVSTPLSGNVLVLPRIYIGLQPQQYIAVAGSCADPPGVAAAELAQIATAIVQGNMTVLTLQSPLANTYLPGSVAINANIVLATNGLTVNETLGSGDASTPFQEFFLRQQPLTFTADQSGAGPVSTLSLRINGASWSEVPSLYGAGPHDQVFITWRADDGSTHLMFGDGVTGARLPTGSGNVTATYRTGIGSSGLVGAGAVSLLTTRPFGVRSASNPLPSTDAADPDTPAMLRQSAPLHVLTLDRIVSLQDYENYALAYPGITKALASWIWKGLGRMVVLTVAGTQSAPVAPGGPLAQSLLAEIEAQSDPRVAVMLGPFAQVSFKVGLAVKTDPALIRASVLAGVQTALQAAFCLAARDFGQPVLASEVIACAQAAPGVIGCDLTQFSCPTVAAPASGLPAMLTAVVPQPGQGDPAPAQILVLDPQPIPFTVLP